MPAKMIFKNLAWLVDIMTSTMQNDVKRMKNFNKPKG